MKTFLAAVVSFVLALSSMALAEPTKEQRIVHAIGVVDGIEEHFTKKGLPRVRSLEGILGFDINVAQRDEAWNTYKEGPEVQIVEVPGPVVEVKVPIEQEWADRLFKWDALMFRFENVVANLENRKPIVVEVEKEVFVSDNSAASAECVQLRHQFVEEAAVWGGDEEKVGLEAIKLGCW